MFSFQYKHGDRPLEGFTIERGAGRGGFGEVYYAISDSGREVALKAVLGYEQIELRGISNCMNLKNPHLVTIFDVKYNEAGKPFVIMEFVAGPSLRQLLDQSPSGLGTQKAAFFLREMGKGLTYLHDNGIVHRDLKPANVFYENGYVKIGDYGLSKAIAPTQHSAQTITVGTVHYMAPEIGAGKYDRSIDIYALGAVLYEMLTGMVPFNGATPSEILLKHLGSEIDTTGIPEPFAGVIKKAMAKDPAQRYQSVQEMVEAVFGAEHVRQSVSVFSPDELSVVAGHAALRAAVGGGSGGAGGTSGQAAVATTGDPWERVGAWADRLTDRVAKVGDRVADAGVRVARNATGSGASSKTMEVAPFVDPLSQGQRKLLGLLIAFGVGIAAGILSMDRRAEPVLVIPFVILSILGASGGIQIALRRLVPQIGDDSPLARQLAIGGIAALLGAVASVPFKFGFAIGFNPAGTWLAIYAPLFFMNVASWGAADREERVSFWSPTFFAGLFAFILATVFHGSWVVSAFTLGGICLVTQILSPWNKEAAKAREAREEKDEESNAFKWAFANAKPAVPPGVVTPGAPGAPGAGARVAPPPPLPRVFKVVPGVFRVIWLALSIISAAIGVSMLVASAFARSYDFGMFLGNGLGFLWGSLMFLIQAGRARFYGAWSYLIRPLVILAAGLSILIPLVIMGTERLSGEEIGAAVFFIVLGALTMVAVWVIPATFGRSPMQGSAAESPAPPLPTSSAPSTRPWYARRRRRLIYLRGPWNMGGFVFSLISTVLVVLAIVATLGAGLKAAQAVYWGIPDAQLAVELNRDVFPDYSDWPKLVEAALRTIGILLTLIAIGFCTLARRRAGWIHMMRGIFGIALLVGSFGALGEAFHRVDWWSISVDVHANRIATAVGNYFNHAETGLVALAAVMFVISQIVILWPAGDKRAKSLDSTGSAEGK